MNMSVFCSGNGVYTSYECIKGYTFRNAASWVTSVLLPVKAAVFGKLRDNCAHFRRIECLSPHLGTA